MAKQKRKERADVALGRVGKKRAKKQASGTASSSFPLS
jgi:hypothetical protein